MAKEPLTQDDPLESLENLKKFGTKKFLYYVRDHSVAMVVGLVIGVVGALVLSFINTPVRDFFIAIHVKSYEDRQKEYELRIAANDKVISQLRADLDQYKINNEKLAAVNRDVLTKHQEEERRAKSKEEAEARLAAYWEPRLLSALEIDLDQGDADTPWVAYWSLRNLSDADIDKISTVTYRFGSIANWQKEIWETHTSPDFPTFYAGIAIGRFRPLKYNHCPYSGSERATITIRLKTGETVTTGLFPPCQAFKRK